MMDPLAEWPKYERLVWRLAHKIGKPKQYRSEEVLGTVYEVYVRCCQLFDPSRGTKFSSYFATSCWRWWKIYFLRWDSEHAAYYWYKKLRGPDDERRQQMEYNEHEICYHLYRPPSLEADWIDDVMTFVESSGGPLTLRRLLVEWVGQRAFDVLSLRHVNGLTQEQIGRDQKPPVTKQAIAQVEGRAMRKIREGFDRLAGFAALFMPAKEAAEETA